MPQSRNSAGLKFSTRELPPRSRNSRCGRDCRDIIFKTQQRGVWGFGVFFGIRNKERQLLKKTTKEAGMAMDEAGVKEIYIPPGFTCAVQT